MIGGDKEVKKGFAYGILKWSTWKEAFMLIGTIS